MTPIWRRLWQQDSVKPAMRKSSLQVLELPIANLARLTENGKSLGLTRRSIANNPVEKSVLVKVERTKREPKTASFYMA